MRELFMNTEETNHANGSQCRDRTLSCEAHFPIFKYSQSVWKHKSLCGFLFNFLVPCLSSYMPRAEAAYEYSQSGLMHIQPFYLKYCTF